MSDATVGDILLEEILQPASAGMSTADLNCVVDGFPRTAVQVRFTRRGGVGTADAWRLSSCREPACACGLGLVALC